jgi:hypothetical protein
MERFRPLPVTVDGQLKSEDKDVVTVKNEEGNAKAASIVNVVAGIWLVLSPFLLGYSNSKPDIWSNIVAGLIVLIVGWVNAADPARSVRRSWINMLAGIWVFISAFILGHTNTQTMFWNDLIIGALVVIMAIVSAAQSAKRPIEP